jgi:hypothetical protein
MKGEYDAFDGLGLSVAMSRQARAGGFCNGTAIMNDQGAECWIELVGRRLSESMTNISFQPADFIWALIS